MDFLTEEQENEINILANNKTPLNNAYISTIVGNYYGFNNNSNSLSQIIESINDNLAELTYIQNQLNTVNNLQQEEFLKKETLLKLQNEKLMEQLRTLENIQSVIINKDRNIEQINENIEYTNINIRVLSFGIFLSLLLLVIIILYGFKIIDDFQRNVLIVIIAVLFFILLMYIYNIFNFKDSMNGISKKKNILTAAVKGLDEFKKEASENIRESLYGDQHNWIEENCDCPLEENDVTEENSYAYDINKTIKEIPGAYYYDNSAPPQLLVPSPDSTSIQSNEKINWVDYSDNGVLRYNTTTHKVSNENKNYYNYKNLNKKKDTNLNKTNTLVNSITTTGNL